MLLCRSKSKIRADIERSVIHHYHIGYRKYTKLGIFLTWEKSGHLIVHNGVIEIQLIIQNRNVHINEILYNI